MAAKDALRSVGFGLGKGSFGGFLGQSHPASIHAVQKTREALPPGIELLQLEIQIAAEAGKAQPVIDDEIVELMAMDGQMTPSGMFPDVLLVNRNSDQMRHHLR